MSDSKTPEQEAPPEPIPCFYCHERPAILKRVEKRDEGRMVVWGPCEPCRAKRDAWIERRRSERQAAASQGAM